MTEIKSKVIALLKSYPSKKRQIEQLRFELEHPALIGEKELIDSLSFGVCPPGEGGLHSGNISNKTMTIALQYQDVLQRLNNETITDIVQELRLLESEIARIEHYLSLLEERKATAIRLLYFDKKTWSEAEKEMNISQRTLLNYRRDALNELASMYSYIDSVKGGDIDKSK